MKTNDLYGFMSTSALESLRRIQEQFNNSALTITMKELQQTIDAVKIPADGITAALQTFHDSTAPLTAAVQHINALYTPILEQTRKYENLYNNAMVSALQSSTTALKTMAGLDFSAIQSIVNSLSHYDFLSIDVTKSINFDSVAELYGEGKITNEDIAEEFNEIVSKKEFSFVETWDNIKKAKWFLAIRWVLVILMFLGSPVIDKVKDKTLEALGVNEFWEESGIYEWFDEVFGIEKDDGIITEQKAKEAVSDKNIGNISRKKREDLLNKIKEIRNFIATAPQDENTNNLLSYLAELEKDVNGKKYGLVYEEHREEIDEVLDTYTPVLTEEKDLFIDNGGQMNFLIEGDNLASLQLLKKTHNRKIDLIYIDPPYNTGNKDFTYDDVYVDSLDNFKHSKWLSFMRSRISLAKKLLSDTGLVFISIDDNEVAQLKILCDEIFGNSNFRGQIVRATGTPTGQGNATISNEIDYVLVYARTTNAIFNGLPFDDESSKIYNLVDEYGRYLNRPLRKTGGEDRREDRPSMYYPIFAPDGTEIYPIAPSGYESRWRCQESTYHNLVKEHRIEWKKDKKGWKVYQKFYLEGRTKQPGNLWVV